MNIKKKIVAIVTSLTVVAFVAAPVSGQSVSDLQAQIAALLAQLNSLQSQLNTLQGTGAAGTGACAGITFTRPLSQGASGADVKCLQSILNQAADTKIAASGAGSPGNESTYFGSLTKAAVVKFQVKYASEILTPSGLTNGTGYVGNKTIVKLNTMVGGGGGGGTPVGGENKVSLAADSPASASVARGAKDVIFAKINFCAASAANTVSQIALTRTGIAADTDLSNVKLYEGVTQVGSTQAINSTTHKATFSSLNWTIAANTCKTLSVKGTIAAGATAGDTPKLAINAATDITATVALDGVFPVTSNGMTVAGISTGALNVATTTHNTTVVAGAAEQAVASFIFTASSTEGAKIYSLTVTEVGTSVDSDVSNLKLFYQSTQLGSAVAALSNGSATFDLSSSPFELLVSTSKTLTVYADVGTGTGVQDRTIQFEITDNTDATAYGSNSGGSVPIYGGSGTWNTSDTWPQKTDSVDIVLGSLVISKDETYSPAAQEYAKGTTDNDLIAFKFLAGANEGVRVTEIKLMRSDASLDDTDVSNITLWDAETGARLKDTSGNTIGASSQISGYVDIGSHTTGFDSTGLFDLEKGKYKIILVKADVPSGAATDTTVLGYEIDNPTTQVWADGLSSRTDMKTTDINGGAVTSVPSTALTHDIIEKGTLTVSVNSGTPASQGYALGSTGFTFAKFDLKATGEDILVSQLSVYFATSSTAGATTTAADSADINNVAIYDGDTLLKTDTAISSGYADFSVNLTVPKNGTKTITVKADIPSTSDAAALTAWFQKAADISVTGKSSNTTITATASNWSTVKGSVMLKGTPILTIRAATTPASKTVVSGTTQALVATLYLTATNTEDIKVTRIQIAGDSTSTATSTANTATSSFETPVTGLGAYDVHDYVGNIMLFDGSTQVGVTVPIMTDGTNYDYANFTGLNMTVAKGTTKVIDVKLDVVQATTSTGNTNAFYFGIATTTAASVDISAAGIQSGSTATYVIETGGQAGQPMFFGTSGTLALTSAADMPISAQLLEGSTANSLGKWKFTGGTEAIKVSKVVFDAHHSNASATTVLIPEAGIWQLGTTGNVTKNSYAFNYSIGGAATATCYFNYSRGPAAATSSDFFIATINNTASTTCSGSSTAGIYAYAASTTVSSVTYVGLYASTTGSNRSLQLLDYPNPYTGGGDASNTLDTLKGGLKYGSAETIAKITGDKANMAKLSLYANDVWVADAYLDAQSAGRVAFNLPTGSEITVPAASSKYITLKGDVSNYLAATEGSTIYFSVGSTTATDDEYLTAKGASSGATLDADAITLNTNLDANEYYFYATKPTVTLNSSSPSGARTAGANEEVMRFDVTNTNSGFDATVDAIRFTITTNASSAAFDKTFKLYKSTDLNTIIGQAVSVVPSGSATSSAVTGYVTMYPWAGNVAASGATVTYILKMNTSSMNSVSGTTNDQLTLSIEDGDFYFDDGLTTTANQKVLNLPVTTPLLTY